MFRRVRRLRLALPETTEAQSWEHPNCSGCPVTTRIEVRKRDKGDPLTSYQESNALFGLGVRVDKSPLQSAARADAYRAASVHTHRAFASAALTVSLAP